MIVAYENRIVMQETLEAGLAELFDDKPPPPSGSTSTAAPPPVRRPRAVPVHP